MAKFVLAEGEEVIDRTMGEMNLDGVMRSARLILTNRRVLAIAQPKPSWFLPPVLSKLLSATEDRITGQLRRDDLAEIEVTGVHSLKLRNAGDGYGLVWFEIEKLAQRDDWKRRLDDWLMTR